MSPIAHDGRSPRREKHPEVTDEALEAVAVPGGRNDDVRLNSAPAGENDVGSVESFHPGDERHPAGLERGNEPLVDHDHRAAVAQFSADTPHWGIPYRARLPQATRCMT